MAGPRNPIGLLIQSLFTVQRIGTTITGEGQVLLEALFDQLVRDLQRIDPTAPALPKWRRYRTDAFLELVAKRLRDVFPGWTRLVQGGLAQAGRAQGKFAETVLVSSLGDGGPRVQPTPITQVRVRSILNANPFQGATLKEWAGGLERVTLDRISKQVKVGMTAEESLPDIVRRVRGSQAGYLRQDPSTGQFVPKGTKGAIVRPRFKGGVWSSTTRDAESVVRSAVSFIDGQSKLATYRKNARILRVLEFQAILDDRTSDICFSLDGEQWPLDSDEIVVPGEGTHFGGCRSELVPVIDYVALGLNPPEEGERLARDLSGLSAEDLRRKVGTRRGRGKLGEQKRVPSSLRAEQWLRNQPHHVLDKILGPGRAQLFRDRKITLKQLVRSDGTSVLLSELAA